MRETPRLRPAAFIASLSLALLSLASARAEAAPGPSLSPANATGTPIASHAIGDDLLVSLAGATPLGSYSIELRDEGGSVVATTQLRADRFGSAKPAPLWSHSGVVGCDPGANPDPSSYRFDDFDQAEAFLDGRVFSLVALDSTHAIAATALLPLAIRTTPLLYLSDASGCPRWQLSTQDDVFGWVKQTGAAQSARLWVVPFQISWQEGDPLDDLRAAYPEGLVLTLTPEFHETWQLMGMIWDDPPQGDFCAVIQLYPMAAPPLQDWLRAQDLQTPGAIQCVAIYGLAHDEPW